MTSYVSSTTVSDPLAVLDASEQGLQLVLGGRIPSGPALLAGQYWSVPGRTTSVLAPALEQVLAGFELTLSDLRGVACVHGPGSFTGLRIVLSFAAGLMTGAGVPLAGLNRLELIARSAVPALNHDAEARSLAVGTYARRGQIYLQGFRLPELTPLAPLAAYDLESAARAMTAMSGPLCCVGSGIRRNATFFAEALPQARLLPAMLDRPRPEAMLEAALEADYRRRPLDALYVRPSDAEENLSALAPSRGLTPREACERLNAARSGRS